MIKLKREYPESAEQVYDDVIYKGERYQVGNRYHTLLELYKNGYFVKTVSLDLVKVLIPKQETEYSYYE